MTVAINNFSKFCKSYKILVLNIDSLILKIFLINKYPPTLRNKKKVGSSFAA